MTTETRTVQELLRWGSKAIFLVTETEVATGVRDLFLQAADRIDVLEKALGEATAKLREIPELGREDDATVDEILELLDAALSPPSDDSEAQAGSMK